MVKEEQFKFSLDVVIFPLSFVLLLWLIFALEIRFGFRLNKYGVQPQSLVGLRGVLFSPFIHSGITHLYHNSIPLVVLSAALFYFYHKIAWKVILYGILISGFLTWCIGRPSTHIGASGLIYVLVSFIFFKGVIAKHYRLIALSLLVVFLYGSMVWYTLPLEEGISWEGHLSGMITGIIFAYIFKKEIAKPKTYAWEDPDYNEEEDFFLQHFDEDGNFIENRFDQDEEEIKELEDNILSKIKYTFKPNSDSKES